MAGRPDFSTAGSQGSGQTVAVSNRPEVSLENVSSSTTVAAGSSERVDVYAPAGSIYRGSALELNVQAPGSATTGSHEFIVGVLGTAAKNLRGQSNYNTDLLFSGGGWYSADAKSLPGAGGGPGAVANLRATENAPIAVKYTNSTDVSQSNQRFIYIALEEESY